MRIHVPIPLRWSDFDAYAHVNNAEMLRLLEEARVFAFWVDGDLADPVQAQWSTAVIDAGPQADTKSVISHDRWFLDRVVTHILAYEGTEEEPDKWYWFEGNFDSYEKNKVTRLGEDAARPHRVTYRKLTRD